ncbi:Glutathione-regulated potassium-efflux system protein KefB [uncultured archaeon]|nr:Glutathione-regulated potassium-efflux system protein KefB [uncultured archaeon]
MMLPELMPGIEFQMSLLLFFSLVGYLLASRVNQSAVISEIIVGLLIGPSVLGVITYTDFVRSIAQLGAIILLFVVGLEFKFEEIFRLKYAAIALVGVVLPWVGGYLTAVYFGFGFVSSVFVGTALTATSIAITASVLKEMNKLGTPAAKAIIGAAVIDDILSLLALAFTNQISDGNIDYLSIIAVLLKAVLFLVVGSLLGKYFFNKKIVEFDSSKMAKRYPEMAFIYTMAIAFLYSMIAETIGLSAIVGAFIAGVSMGNVKLKNSLDFKEGSNYFHVIFASIFFVSLGIIADLHALNTGTIAFLLILTVVAVLTKVVGCGFTSKLVGFSNKDSIVIGFGMSPRGEVAMIVALIGLTKGVIHQDVYVTLVLMSLLTTAVTPMILRNGVYR